MSSGSVLDDALMQEIFNPFPVSSKKPFVPIKKKAMIIAGPTGVGKTEISIRIAGAIGGEIISADSMQMYRDMNIGTAKVTPATQGGIRHHLIDSRGIDEVANVVDFYHEAQQAFQEIYNRNHVPIVVGGTGFYIHSLIYGPPKGPPPSFEIRAFLEREMERRGALSLYEELKELDPEYAATITEKDRRKIIRALEIMQVTQQKVSSFKEHQIPAPDFDFRCWFLYKPKEVLYPILDRRCDWMIAEGFIEEVKRLEKEGIRSNPSASSAIGYRECLDYLQTEQSTKDWDRFVKKFKQATRQYAKRQCTWFRKEPLFHWVNLEELGVETVIAMLIQDYERN